MAVFAGRRINLEWPEAHEFHGLEVSCVPLSTGDLIEIWSWAQAERSPEVQVDVARQRGALLARVVRAWNYNPDDGADEPWPINEDTMIEVDHALAIAITSGLTQAIGGVPGPLSESSDDGDPSGELGLSELMEYPSEDPGN